jgi:hypothetical protein
MSVVCEFEPFNCSKQFDCKHNCMFQVLRNCCTRTLVENLFVGNLCKLNHRSTVALLEELTFQLNKLLIASFSVFIAK